MINLGTWDVCAHEEGGLLGTKLQITLLQNMSPFCPTFHLSSMKKYINSTIMECMQFSMEMLMN
jgi:hypothetical protein